MQIAFDNTYARLPERFYARLHPNPAAAPKLVRLNRDLAEHLGIDPDALAAPDGVAMLAGGEAPPNAKPIALAYAGDQFGHFVPQLGDGRACLLGEVVGRDGIRRDIQLKGSGATPFSRSGDGRAALGPVLREYLVSEAMHALGVPTTRTLAAVTTGETVWRDTALPGAVVARVATSHIRVGTFQYFAARRDVDGLRVLADYAIARHYQDAQAAANPYLAFLNAVIAGQARLVAQWLLIGFIHGVMNTDNCSIAGETIDYGPCAFMDTYDLGTVFSSIDHFGRYAYGNQPRIALWNVARLAECLLPLLGEDAEAAKEALAGFAPAFQSAYLGGLRRKIGLLTEQPDDDTLTQQLRELMLANATDFTRTFRLLCDAAEDPAGVAAARALFRDTEAFDAWAGRWHARLAQEANPAATMRAVNPAFIPRNHLVEAALKAAVDHADYQPFDTMLRILSQPYRDHSALERYATPPEPGERVLQTFCGT